ncbi:MAG TPA: YhjD/YihY/BrkB family envelope integrity protein [Jatrophihabitans sp.]|jgi:inner membrane protein YhjD|uniref:YihY/virulence factor BrkB family protein n=1 Tax=Jatrophihabitans sp. TaxID=1932789 RepID=UPI002EE1DBE6
MAEDLPQTASRITKALDRFQRRHRWAGMPLAVLYKFIDDQGNVLAALITYYAFISLFPLLLLLVTVLGYALHGNEHLQLQVLNSALSQFPVIGDQLRTNIDPLHGKVIGLVVGILGSMYGGLGVAQACQNAMNKVWAVPRHARPNVFRARGISLLLLMLLGTGVLATTILSGLTTSAGAYGIGLSIGARILSTVLSVAVNAVLFMVAFQLMTAEHITLAQVRGGALAAAICWQLLQVVGTYYVAHDLKDASATYGVFGLVLGAIAWIYLGALVIVMSAEYSAVRARKLWPRSLLAPFTDNVRLTEGDRRAYASYPKTEKHKEFESVEVEFHEPDGADDSGEASEPDGFREAAEPDDADGSEAPDVPRGPDQPAKPGPAGSGA